MRSEGASAYGSGREPWGARGTDRGRREPWRAWGADRGEREAERARVLARVGAVAIVIVIVVAAASSSFDELDSEGDSPRGSSKESISNSSLWILRLRFLALPNLLTKSASPTSHSPAGSTSASPSAQRHFSFARASPNPP
uniref:Uncharacterized protein n=1 Tax=Ananas comosus var. bracteatus TaxID=296719 RepID=A0A6V7PS64_ANACO|nr:unnamed protein product [Ananas comosus var. bracteatus]